MTVTDLFELCQKAGLWEKDQTSFRNKVNHLARASVIPNQEGGGGNAKMGHYPPGTDLRLLCALTLEEPAPRGLGYGRAEELRAFLGAVGAERTVDEFLPAVAFVMGVPGVDVEEARRSGRHYLRHWLEGLKADLERLEEPAVGQLGSAASRQTALIRQFAAMAFGNEEPGSRQSYRSPDIYETPDGNEEWTRTLRDEIVDGLELPAAYQGVLDARDMSRLAHIINPASHYAALGRAKTEVLCEAAFWARLSMTMAGTGPAPRAETLLAFWGFFVAVLTYQPEARQWLRLLQPFLSNPSFLKDCFTLTKQTEFEEATQEADFDRLGIIVTNELYPLP